MNRKTATRETSVGQKWKYKTYKLTSIYNNSDKTSLEFVWMAAKTGMQWAIIGFP